MLLQVFNWNGPFFHNRVIDWVLAAAFLSAALFLARPLAAGIARVASAIIRKVWEPENKRAFSDVIRVPLGNLLALLFAYMAVFRLTWPFNFVVYARAAEAGKAAINISLLDVADRIFLFLIIIQTGLVLARTVDFFFHMKIREAQKKHQTDELQLFPLMRDMTKILLWAMAFFWMLGSVFNVNIPALIAGLGIGGVAIALAAKESVENFFAAFMILTDKPFQTGESIRLGTLEGTVERIGFRSTRLRHADGSMFIIPNKSLVGQNLENLSKRIRSRVQLKVLMRNTLPSEKLGELIDLIEERIRKTAQVRQPVTVNLVSFGETNIELLLSYHLPIPSLGEEQEQSLKQDIALQIYAMLSEYGAVAGVAEPTPQEAGKALTEPDTKEES